jgi:hypothetical protein
MPFARLTFRIALLALAVLALAFGAHADVADIAGAWIIDDSADGTEFSTATIDEQGGVTFTEVYRTDYKGEEYVFDITHTGTFATPSADAFTYSGTGTGTARESGGTITVQFVTTASGSISPDKNLMAGYWAQQETYDSPQGQVTDQDDAPLLMTRADHDPGTPGAEVEGVWLITLSGENVDWSGQVTLNDNGTMTGYLDIAEDTVPLAGLFTYSESNEMEFVYTTTLALPIVGERTFSLEAEGQGNESNTEITGTWAFSVTVSGNIKRNFSGSFKMTKVSIPKSNSWLLR